MFSFLIDPTTGRAHPARRKSCSEHPLDLLQDLLAFLAGVLQPVVPDGLLQLVTDGVAEDPAEL